MRQELETLFRVVVIVLALFGLAAIVGSLHL